MDVNQQNNKIPELSAKVFTSSCKVVNIEDISHTKNINKNLREVDVDKINNKKDK